VLIFVSASSMQSEFVLEELAVAAQNPDRLIIPVILQQTANLPPAIAERFWIDLSKTRGSQAVRQAVNKIVEATKAHLDSVASAPPVAPPVVSALAETIAQETRSQAPAPETAGKPPDSVFIVHGHDEASRKKVEDYLISLSIKPVVLKNIGGPSQSLFQKFLKFSHDARFAIVLLTGDDLGASRLQYEKKSVGTKALQFRARQNVILELGFFYGYLGWENVFVLYVEPPKVFPNFERPSDLGGVVFDTIDKSGDWKTVLRGKLLQAGFVIKPAAGGKARGKSTGR
jgi:predicted nucleotide-binding protein